MIPMPPLSITIEKPDADSIGPYLHDTSPSALEISRPREVYFRSPSGNILPDEITEKNASSGSIEFQNPFGTDACDISLSSSSENSSTGSLPLFRKHKITLSTDLIPYNPYYKDDSERLSSWRHSNLSSFKERRRASIVNMRSSISRTGQQSLNVAKDIGHTALHALRKTSHIATGLFDSEVTELWHVHKDTFEKKSTKVDIRELKTQSVDDVSTVYTQNAECYPIQHIAAKDDSDLISTRQRLAQRFSSPVLLLSQLLFWGYFVARILFTLSTQRATHSIFPLAWLFLVVECLVALPATFNGAWQMLAIKKRARPKLRLLGNHVPTVDVFVTCCSEDTGLVMDTVLAACTIDWPQDRFRVVILDDGASDELKARAEAERTLRFPNLYYHARTKTKGQPHHFKAGNLNGGLKFIDALPGQAGEFFAALDADMICTKDWLRALVPHLLVDSKLCMSCPPQIFYNTPAGDLLHQSLEFFVHVAESLKDTLGVAWCTGSGYVVRRLAMADIGGAFPYGSLAEDVCFSSMLLGAGWRSAYVHEPLQFGLVPDTFEGHIKQRTRWTIGTIQTAIKLKFCIWGPLARSMTVPQRICGSLYTVVSFFYIFLAIAIFTIPVVLISGGTMVAYRDAWQLRFLLRFYFADLVIFRISEFMLFQASGYYTGKRGGPNALWMCPYYAITIIRSFLLPKWLGGTTMAFKPSGSRFNSDLNERDVRLRAPLWRRMWVMFFHNMVWFHCTQIVLCAVGVILSSVRCVLYINEIKVGGCFIAHAAWAPLAWLSVSLACYTPIHYTLFPPTMPDREELLNRDEDGVAQPKASAIRKSTRPDPASHGLEVVSDIILVVGVIYFIVSWFLPDNIVFWRIK